LAGYTTFTAPLHDKFLRPTEAIQGGSRAEQLSGKMANTLSASNRLFKTYVPVDVATVREVDSSREAARRKERTANKKSKDAGQTSLRKTDPKR
jgi:hypothetical protein